jgi:hypothetical protein
VAVRVPPNPVLRMLYRRKNDALSSALGRSWFLHFAGFRLGLVLASM